MAEEYTRDLLHTLDVQPLQETAHADEADVFVGPSQHKPDGRVFGGQVLAQCVRAADLTVADDRHLHSLHGYFLRAGDTAHPIEFGVDRLRDGGSFSARRVQAYQHGKPIMSMILSFQLDQPGHDAAVPLPGDVPAPEDLVDIADLLRDVQHPQIQEWILKRPFDYRPIDPLLFGAHHGDRKPRQRAWIRLKGEIPADRGLHAAILAYASDFSLLEPALREAGASWGAPGLKVASIDHAMWFHRPVRVDDWLLYEAESPSAENGRGMGRGLIHQRDGRLVATVAQQGVVRLPS